MMTGKGTGVMEMFSILFQAVFTLVNTIVKTHSTEDLRSIQKALGDFPSGPAVGTPSSQCREPGFDSRSGN